MFKTSKYLLLSFFGWALFSFISSCKKTDEAITGKAKITLVHTAYGIEPVSLTSSGSAVTASPVNFGQVSGTADDPYININAGLRSFGISGATTLLYNANYNIRIGAGYSLLVFDSLNANGNIKTLLLQDELSLPDSGKAGIRFFNLSRDAGPVDVFFISSTDTLLKEDNVYPGELPPTDALAAFNSLDSGSYTVTVNIADTTIQLADMNTALEERKKYSFFIAGRRSDGSLRIYRYRHF